MLPADQSDAAGASQDQHSLIQSIVLHLAPGAIFTAFLVLSSWVGIDTGLALFVGIGIVLVPLELGYLAIQARRTTGSWSPLRVVDYRNPLPLRQLVARGVALAAWFLFVLIISIAVIDQWLSQTLFAWMPEDLLQLADPGQDEEEPGGAELVAFLVVALLFNGLIGPVTEELYFRGHLLPRLERYGRWAPVMNTVLFAVYHFFSPWRYPAIIVGFMPITWMAWQTRSIYLSIAAHTIINMITVLLLVAALTAGD